MAPAFLLESVSVAHATSTAWSVHYESVLVSSRRRRACRQTSTGVVGNSRQAARGWAPDQAFAATGS